MTRDLLDEITEKLEKEMALSIESLKNADPMSLSAYLFLGRISGLASCLEEINLLEEDILADKR